MLREDVEELLGEESEALFCDGYDDCIIGVANRFGMEPIVSYDLNKMLKKMIDDDGMTHEEALEHYHYNIIGGWHGDGTPIFIEIEE
jgi:hypothetical protein